MTAVTLARSRLIGAEAAYAWAAPISCTCTSPWEACAGHLPACRRLRVHAAGVSPPRRWSATGDIYGVQRRRVATHEAVRRSGSGTGSGMSTDVLTAIPIETIPLY